MKAAFSATIGRRMLQKNGLDSRRHEERVSKILGGVAFGYLALCFIAPYLLPSDSVPELSGRANAIDYAFENGWGNDEHEEGGSVGHNQVLHGGKFVWSELNPIWALAYGFGDLNCHQKHERSWEINGNQMPVCARDIGIFMGFSVGCLFFLLRGYNRWTVRDTFLSVFHDEWLVQIYEMDRRMLAMLIIMGIGLIPMGIDGTTQLLLDSYESNNLLRLITGFGSGFVGGWWFCSAFSARPKFFLEASNVTLPAGSRLVVK
ncbi:MAG: DUF2085 domain-containing protein [Candidatus Thermoplasmatota archaeon]|nr:DUF2085 domain-containing protein [Candidatus Thermoplasmatota archaeon]